MSEPGPSEQKARESVVRTTERRRSRSRTTSPEPERISTVPHRPYGRRPLEGDLVPVYEEWLNFNNNDSASSDDDNGVDRLQFSNIFLSNARHMSQLREFLYDNYTLTNPEYATDFSEEFLIWALLPPGSDSYFHFGIRDENGDLVGFIGAVPRVVRFDQKSRLALAVVLMCTKQEANPELDYTQELLNEMSNRAFTRKIKYTLFTGMFTKYPWKSVARLPLYERYLNVQRLIDSGYLNRTDDEQFALFIQQAELVDHPLWPGVRPLNKNPKNIDTKIALRWVDNGSMRLKTAGGTYLRGPGMNPTCVTPVEGVLSSFFIKNQYVNPPKPGETTYLSDFFSFYKIRQVCKRNPSQSFTAAFLFQQVVSPDFPETVTPLDGLIGEAMKRAQMEMCDLFVVPEMEDMKESLVDWQFVRMEHEHEQLFKRYYVFNGNFRTVECEDVPLVFL